MRGFIAKYANRHAGTTDIRGNEFSLNYLKANMKTWKEALCDGAISGSIGSVATTVVLGKRGELECGTPFAPTNAISHWIWGDHAMHRGEASARYTLLGYTIHHASATLWAVVYEKWFGEKAEKSALVPALGGGAAIAALACFVDYKMTPKRLRPGYEKRLSTRSLFLLYSTFGIAITLRGLVSGTGGSR
jgi:hypothetical protein